MDIPTGFMIEQKLKEIHDYGGCIDFINGECDNCNCCEFDPDLKDD